MKHIVIMNGSRVRANLYTQQYLTNENDEIYFLDISKIIWPDNFKEYQEIVKKKLSEKIKHDPGDYQLHVISGYHKNRRGGYVTNSEGEFPALKTFLEPWCESHPNSCYMGMIWSDFWGDPTDQKIFPEKNRRIIKFSITFREWFNGFFSKPKKLPVEIITSSNIFFEATNNKDFLKELERNLDNNNFTRANILDFFNEIKKPKGGRYDFIHDSSLVSKFFVFFKSRRNSDEVNFWHTETYQTAVKLLKNAYIQQEKDLSAINRKPEENVFLDYFRGNAPIHGKETSSRKKIRK